jgi:hypothetical protein
MTHWILPSAIGFFMGSSGYILYRFYFKPITKYRRLKTRIKNSLAHLDKEAPPKSSQKPGALAAQLTQCYSDDLPVWFQLLLKRRGEDPQAAAGHLMTLAKTKNPDHARRRIHQIEEALKLKQ